MSQCNTEGGDEWPQYRMDHRHDKYQKNWTYGPSKAFFTWWKIDTLSTYPICCILAYATIFPQVCSLSLGCVTFKRCYSPLTSHICIVPSPSTTSSPQSPVPAPAMTKSGISGGVLFWRIKKGDNEGLPLPCLYRDLCYDLNANMMCCNTFYFTWIMNKNKIKMINWIILFSFIL